MDLRELSEALQQSCDKYKTDGSFQMHAEAACYHARHLLLYSNIDCLFLMFSLMQGTIASLWDPETSTVVVNHLFNLVDCDFEDPEDINGLVKELYRNRWEPIRSDERARTAVIEWIRWVEHNEYMPYEQERVRHALSTWLDLP